MNRVHGGTKAREASAAAEWQALRSFFASPHSSMIEGLDMTLIRKTLLSFCAATMLAVAPFSASMAAPKKEFNIAWTIYVGWMPWPYAVDAGIVKKWGD